MTFDSYSSNTCLFYTSSSPTRCRSHGKTFCCDSDDGFKSNANQSPLKGKGDSIVKLKDDTSFDFSDDQIESQESLLISSYQEPESNAISTILSSVPDWNDEVVTIYEFLGWRDSEHISLPEISTNYATSDNNEKSRVVSGINEIFQRLTRDLKLGNEPSIQLLKNFKRKRNGEPVQCITVIKFSESKKFASVIRCLQIIHDLLTADIITTKRDVFYKDVELFGNQREVDRILEDLAVHFQVSRYSLNIVASSKGLVAGNLTLKMLNGAVINCSQCSEQGILIPPAEQILSVSVDDDAELKFILVVEKACTFSHMLNADFCRKFGPCVILTGKGFPDIATRQLLRLLSNICANVPILGLMDNDPFGIDILATYKYGSKAMEEKNENLAVPRMEWLGLHCRDWIRFGIPDDALMPLSDTDRKRGLDLLKRPFIKNEPEWKKEIARTLWTGRKAELQSLCMFDSMGMLRDYFPTKLSHPEEWL